MGGWGGDILIQRGRRADYDRLAPWHYIAAAPAVVERILRAVWKPASGPPVLAGVLVTSRPALFGWWRDLAWPGLYIPRSTGPTRTRAARCLNRDVRTIARVVVDPRFRSGGVATALVRHYLRRPASARTEAVAAMGEVCPFFERAGMTLWRRDPDESSADFAAWLARRGVHARDLICADRAEALFRDRSAARAIRAWASRSFSTCRYLHHPPATLAAAVATRLWAPRLAYTAGT